MTILIIIKCVVPFITPTPRHALSCDHSDDQNDDYFDDHDDHDDNDVPFRTHMPRHPVSGYDVGHYGENFDNFVDHDD